MMWSDVVLSWSAGHLLADLSNSIAGQALAVAAAVGLILIVGVGAMRLTHRRSTAGVSSPLPSADAPRPELAPTAPEPVAAPSPLAAFGVTFQAWLAERAGHVAPWPAFDQLVRELLTEHLGATRVRCYHVRPGNEALRTLSQSGDQTPDNGPALRAGLLGHVATTGNEYVAGDSSQGQLVHDLAAQSDNKWAWVWPVRERNAVVGIVAAGSPRDPSALLDSARRPVGAFLSLCWQHVACLERLGVAQRTDRASGVLTRSDFFTLGEHALADSYQENEPVVVAVLALEGLRRLDDGGCWRERDTLIERVGQLISHRVRADDLVGRFSDDRFALLLRRLDSGLGRLIAEKMLVTAGECVAQLGSHSQHVRLRVGLVGSGFDHPALNELLVTALANVERARRDDLSIADDVGSEVREVEVQ